MSWTINRQGQIEGLAEHSAVCVPEVWGSVYDIRELLSSSVKLIDCKSPLGINMGPLNPMK